METARRVVVTGYGAVTPLGNDAEEFWRRLVAGESGVRTTQSFDPGRVTSRMSGEVIDFDPSHVLGRKEIKRNDRFTQFALVATREAMDRAGLPERLEGELAESTGVVIGTGLGGTGTLIEQIALWATRGPDRLSPFFIPMAIANMAAGQVAMSFGAMGPDFAPVSACASSGHAIGEAYEIIRRADAEVMLAGGTEAVVYETTVGAFAAMRALSTRNDDPAGASRPFDTGRDGFVISEGAATLVLEELEHARRRGVPILAELCGYGATADAYHITLPAPGGSGRPPRGPPGAPEGGHRTSPRSTCSARMPPAPPTATWPSCRPSALCSARVPRAPPSPPPRAPSGTPSALPVPSPASPRCWRCAMAWCRPRSTWSTPTPASRTSTARPWWRATAMSVSRSSMPSGSGARTRRTCCVAGMPDA